MAKELDPRLKEILVRYGEKPAIGSKGSGAALWDCHGTLVAYHDAIERIAARAGVTFDMPQIIEADSASKTVAIAVRGVMLERAEWSFGEAAPSNNKNAYPYAMAEKRAKDRVVLKLVGLHGLVYSEEESDDFKPQAAPKPRVEDSEKRNYPEPPRRKSGLPAVGWREDGSRTSYWLKNNGTFEELKAQLYEDAADCHSLVSFSELRAFYREKAREGLINKDYHKALTEEFASLERGIISSLDAAELAEIPLDQALNASLKMHPLNGG